MGGLEDFLKLKQISWKCWVFIHTDFKENDQEDLRFDFHLRLDLSFSQMTSED